MAHSLEYALVVLVHLPIRRQACLLQSLLGAIQLVNLVRCPLPVSEVVAGDLLPDQLEHVYSYSELDCLFETEVETILVGIVSQAQPTLFFVIKSCFYSFPVD